MSDKKIRWLYLLSASGFFLLVVDQALKYLARHHPTFTVYVWQPWLGWEYLANPGIAFGIPIPNWFLIVVSPLIMLGLCLLIPKKPSLPYRLGVIFILIGALSNFIDRILFGVTIDYLRVVTSIFNLADALIVLGAILLLWSQRKKAA